MPRASINLSAELPGILFDVDGTLVDSVYEHVSAWHRALQERDLNIPHFRIHRAIGMSGKLFLPKLLRELRMRVTPRLLEQLEERQDAIYGSFVSSIKPLPGAAQLLSTLNRRGVPWAIGTSANRHRTKQMLRHFKIAAKNPIVTAEDVSKAKPAPDVFVLAARKLNKRANDCFVVGDSVWDVLAARRMGASGVGLLCGGYSREELQDAGAYRVYQDAFELVTSLEQFGIPSEH
jgi:HAD superfamily hydrolase (TIGR01509 family)